MSVPNSSFHGSSAIDLFKWLIYCKIVTKNQLYDLFFHNVTVKGNKCALIVKNDKISSIFVKIWL